MDDLEKTRTGQQNRALHLWCTMLAKALNDAGYDVKAFLEATDYKMDVPWTPALVKDQLFRPVMKAMTGKESTTEMNTIDPTPIHETVMSKVSEITGVEYINWPDEYEYSRRRG